MSNEYEVDTFYKVFKRKPFPRLRKFFRGIGRLIAYAPVIYHNEEWDYQYLDDLVAFKLKRMIKYHEEHNQFEKKDQYIFEMSMAYHQLTYQDSRGEGYRRAAYAEIANKSCRWWW